MLRSFGLALTLAVLSCAPSYGQQARCSFLAPIEDPAFTPPAMDLSSDLADLVGTFDLILVESLGGTAMFKGDLVLQPISLPVPERESEESILWGYVDSKDSLPVTVPGRDLAERSESAPSVEASYGRDHRVSLSLGNEPSRTHTGMVLYVTEASPTGFRGRWFDGFPAKVVDHNSGKYLGMHQGYFCAFAGRPSNKR